MKQSEHEEKYFFELPASERLYRMASSLSRLAFVLAKVAYVLLSIALLVFILKSKEHDALDASGLFLMALSFPSCYVVAAIFASFFYAWQHFAGTFPNSPDIVLGIVGWLAFVPVGYFQWFVLIPWVWRRILRFFANPEDHGG